MVDGVGHGDQRLYVPRRMHVMAALALTAPAWLWLLAGHRAVAALPFCSTGGIAPLVTGQSLRLLLITNPPMALMQGWLAMLGAMMPPLLLDPLAHIGRNVMPRRRIEAMAAFLGAYGLVWCLAGLPLLGSALALRVTIPAPALAPGIAVGIALLWQMCPARQACRDHGHRFAPLSPCHGRTRRAAALFGLRHGGWCLGTCWALAIVPMMVDGLHMVSMALISLWLWGERLVRPGALIHLATCCLPWRKTVQRQTG